MKITNGNIIAITLWSAKDMFGARYSTLKRKYT
jgi:uncharacterized protein YuzE